MDLGIGSYITIALAALVIVGMFVGLAFIIRHIISKNRKRT